MTIRDFRWKLASWTWAPANLVEVWIEEWQAPRLKEIENPTHRMLAILEVLPGHRQEDFPLRWRILRRLVVDPLSRLSDLIYSDWESDHRGRLSDGFDRTAEGEG